MKHPLFTPILLSTICILSACQNTLPTPVPQVSSQSFSEVERIVLRANTKKFHLVDRDKNSHLNIEEFAITFQNLPLPIPLDNIKAIFANKDENKNGELSLAEFLGDAASRREIVLRMQSSALKIFKGIDLDQDEKVTKKEVALMGIQEAVKHFDRFLPNQNGQPTVNYLRPTDFENLIVYVLLESGYSLGQLEAFLSKK